jgi:hemin uptake protein HemP
MSGSRSRPDPDQAAAPRWHSATLSQAAPLRETRGAATARRWRSTDLFGPAQEIEIEHGQVVYRLRLTSMGKLILTK